VSHTYTDQIPFIQWLAERATRAMTKEGFVEPASSAEICVRSIIAEQIAAGLGEMKNWAMVPTEPPPGLLESMAIRCTHAFGLSTGISDEKINAMRNSDSVLDKMMGGQYMISREREALLADMRRCHEEVVGTGFFKYQK
jgi:hypothetical protein